jgi:hypothetical protein
MKDQMVYSGDMTDWSWVPEGAEVFTVVVSNHDRVPVWKLGRTYHLFGHQDTSLKRLFQQVQQPVQMGRYMFQRVLWDIDCCWWEDLGGLDLYLSELEYGAKWEIARDATLADCFVRSRDIEKGLAKWAREQQKVLRGKIRELELDSRRVRSGARSRGAQKLLLKALRVEKSSSYHRVSR